MNIKNTLKVTTSALLLSSFSNTYAAVNSPDIDAAVVNLRVSCIESGNEIQNCFDDIVSLNNWMNTLRTSNELLVNIGPGTFTRPSSLPVGVIHCNSKNISLRGAGRDHTIITTNGMKPHITAGILLDNQCDNFNVQDLKATGWIQGAIATAATATTTWENVELNGGSYGWLESDACTGQRGKHTWNSSRIVTNGTFSPGSVNYIANCAESWFFASQIIATVNGQNQSGDGSFAVLADNAEVHFYGSNIKLETTEGADANNADLVKSINGGEVHIHGTGLDVIHNGSGNVSYFEADATSMIHANSNAFSLQQSGTGSVERLTGEGKISAPYHWGQSTTPPMITSRSGADTYIETDCPTNNDCGIGGSFPHTMIYRVECNGTGENQGPWYDTVTQNCRQ